MASSNPFEDDGGRGQNQNQQPPPPAYSQAQPEDRIQSSRRQVDEVVGIMRTNIDRVMEREGKLSELDSRAENLHSASVNFARTGNRLRKKFWWENMKMKLCIAGTVAVIILVIVVVAVVELKGDSNDGPQPADVTTTTTTVKP